MNNLLDFIKKNSVGNYKKDVLLSFYTTYKVGGKCKLIVYPKTIDKLILLLEKLKNENILYKVIGNGSNLIFSDNNYDGVIIKLDNLNEVKINDTTVKVGAGVNLIKLSYQMQKQGLSGLEFASGIPGTIGGAVFMNAGAYKSDMGYITSEVYVLTPNLEFKTLYNSEMKFKYRTSFLKENPNYICLGAKLVLMHASKKEIKELMEQRRQKRLLTQPLEYPQAGSVFRNPSDTFAGKLIEDCNLKGYKIGGAEVSLKHANFIINKNNASAEDIKNLITYVHDKVLKETKYDLKIEQEFVNWD